MIEYDVVDDYLAEFDADVNAAETHGTLCGILAAQCELSGEEWLQVVGGERLAMMNDTCRGHVLALRDDTVEAIKDPELGFELLLPDDEDSLEQRVNTLGDWCRGFLFGLSHAGVKDIQGLPGDAGEVVSDFLAISQIGAEGIDPESAEEQLMEINEYVRVGVLLIHDEMAAAQQTDSETVH